MQKRFRETSNMPQSQISHMTVRQLKHSPAQIDRLYYELRNSMNAPTTLTLPLDTTKKVRWM